MFIEIKYMVNNISRVWIKMIIMKNLKIIVTCIEMYFIFLSLEYIYNIKKYFGEEIFFLVLFFIYYIVKSGFKKNKILKNCGYIRCNWVMKNLFFGFNFGFRN